MLQYGKSHFEVIPRHPINIDLPIMKIPYYKQETNSTCGAAALRMALSANGIHRSEKILARLLGTNKISGVRVENFPPILERFKMSYIVARNATFLSLEKILEQKYVIIVGYFDPVWQIGHYAVVKSITKNYIYLLDPHPQFGRDHKYKRAYFNKLWSEGFRYDKENRWFIAIKK